MLWAMTFSRTSACWLAHRTEATEAPSLRLTRLKALSACHRCPYTRFERPPGFLRNRLTICRRYSVAGHLRLPRQFKAMTVERTPSPRRQVAWLASESYAASASTVSSGARPAAARTAGTRCGASWDGPRVTDADRNRWVRVSVTAVSFGQCRWRVGRPDWTTK